MEKGGGGRLTTKKFFVAREEDSCSRNLERGEKASEEKKTTLVGREV